MGNCAPKTHMLRSVMSQNHPWWKALAELVDNSFDAGATAITIECDNNTVSVSDNGCGVADISALLTLGKHVGHKKTQLGIFGIGTKDAWLSCSDVMEVITVNNGTPGSKTKRKQKRRPAQNSTGTVKPVGTSRTIQTAEKMHPDIAGNVTCAGDNSPARKRKGFTIDYCEIDQSEIGDFFPLTTTVMLNLNHPFIIEMKRQGNKPALYSAAVALITDHGIRKPDGRPVFSCTYDSFAKAFGEMMLAFTPQEKSDES